MEKKQDSYYFDTFIDCAGHAVEAVKILRKCVDDYDPEVLAETVEEIHVAEHAADMKKHDLMNVLVRAFITPIEREDIILMSQCLDEVVDKLEDVVLRLYCDNIRTIRPEMVEAVDVIERCCTAMLDMVQDFKNFRHSKTLKEKIISINTMEEEADRIFISNMRKLHTSETSPLDIIIWRDVYRYLEQCADACEHVADVCERVLMNNT